MASWEDFSRIVAESKASKKLDPVGQEDDDVNNDGKVDDTDSYLKNRRSSVGAAISADRKKKSKVKIEVPEKKLGYKVADIGPDGKELNVKRGGAYMEALDPVGQEDDDIDNDGKKNTKNDKYLLNRRKVRSKIIQSKVTEDCGCEDSDEKENNSVKEIDPREMKTKVNLAKTKLRMLGLKMSYEPEGEQIDEFSLPGTGTVLAPKTDPKTGTTRMNTQQKFLGMNVPGTQNFKSLVPSKSDTAKYNANPNRPTTINRQDNFIATSTPNRPQPAAKPQGSPSDKAIQDLRGAASSGQMGGNFQTISNRRAATDAAIKQQLRQSYQPEGEIVEGKKKDDSYLETDIKKRRENNEKAVEDMKKTKGYSDMVKSARKAMGVDEELSLVDVMIAQFSPLNEAPGNTIPGGKRRKGLSKTIQSSQVDKLADEGDYERADKLQDVSSVKLKKNKPQPTASKSPEPEPEKKQERGSKKETAGKSTATERAARTTAASRIKAARIARETEKEKREYKEKIRQEKKTEQQAGSEDRRKSAEEKQQKLKELEKGKRADSAERSAQREYDIKQAKKERLRKQIGAATQIKGPDVVSSKESDAKAIGSVTQGAAQLAAIPFKLAGVALKNANLRRKQKQREEAGRKAKEKSLKDDSQNESFFNWREEFILEVDDQVVNPDKKKIIDVSKKKNNIEINPKIDEAAPLALLAPLAGKIVGGKVAAGITAKGAGMAAKGGLRQKAVEFAARKGGEMASSAVQNKLDPEGERSSDTTGTGISGMLSKLLPGEKRKIVDEAAAWTRSAGKNKSGGLNEKGRKSYEADNPGSDLKAPSKKVGNPRRKSFCARMSGMKAKLTSAKTARDPDSRINKSLRAWNC